MTTDFFAALAHAGEKVEKTLDAILSALPENKVTEAMRYSLMSGGKRLRPALVYETAKLFGKSGGNIDRLAAAIEMIHTYSLIHDDLPCMDDDDFRRGKPSCHKKFGEANAVLAGDALLNLAAETLLDGDFSAEYFRAVAFVFRCSGIYGMVGGQAVDIAAETPRDFETLDYLTENKTAKLMMASVGAACICCGGSGEEFNALVKFAENFGKAFQAADDLLDSAQGDGISYVKILGVHDTKARIAEYNILAGQCVKIFGEKATFFRELCSFNSSREK